jgi:hypothetical protein
MTERYLAVPVPKGPPTASAMLDPTGVLWLPAGVRERQSLEEGRAMDGPGSEGRPATEGRRQFLKKVAIGAFILPVISSFTLDADAAGPQSGTNQQLPNQFPTQQQMPNQAMPYQPSQQMPNQQMPNQVPPSQQMPNQQIPN